MTNAANLNLINYVDDKTGASVRMWAGVDCAPIEWGVYFANRYVSNSCCASTRGDVHIGVLTGRRP